MGKRIFEENALGSKVNFELSWSMYKQDPHILEEIQGLMLQTDAANFVNKESGRFEMDVTPYTGIAGYVNHDEMHNVVDVIITDIIYKDIPSTAVF